MSRDVDQSQRRKAFSRERRQKQAIERCWFLRVKQGFGGQEGHTGERPIMIVGGGLHMITHMT
jgi:hypothetical protein